MKTFTYLISEGVLDVVFLAKLLTKEYGCITVDNIRALPGPARKWLEAFKWPVNGDIARRAVPAPAILLQGESVVGIRSAQGLTRIADTMEADMELFDREQFRPRSLGVVLDADDAPPAQRFGEFAALIQQKGYPFPAALDSVVSAGELRAGVFAFPGGAVLGTIEDVLLPLAEMRFPELSEHARGYVDAWRTSERGKTGGDFKELRKSSGAKKAWISAMAALLKPGKPVNASLEDQNWLGENPRECQAIGQLTHFLDQLLCDNCPNPLA